MKRTNYYWVIILLIAQLNSYAQQNGQSWNEYQDVTEAGFSRDSLNKAEKQFSQMNSSTFMVIHKGNVLLSFGDASRRFMCHSIRKSFISAIYGIYLESGEINLSSTLAELGIQDRETLSNTELSATVKNLISARSGIYHPAAYEPKSMTANRPERGSAKPDESFFYNNWDFNTLVTIFNQETDQDFFEAFVKDIARPIGMEDLRMDDMNYRNEPDKSIHPAYLFKMSTRDLARFGQLYLNEGVWNEEKIIPKKWIKESTITHSTPENFAGRDGYGYLWWIDNHSFGEQAYYASGLGGHLMYVFPESEMVIVHRVNSYLMMGERQEKINKLINLVLSAKTGKSNKKSTLIPFSPEKRNRNVVSVPSEILSKYVGTYNHPFFKEMIVFQDGNQLKVTGEILGNFRLLPKTENSFEVEDVPELPMEMQKANEENPKGTAVTLTNKQRIPTKLIMYY